MLDELCAVFFHYYGTHRVDCRQHERMREALLIKNALGCLFAITALKPRTQTQHCLHCARGCLTREVEVFFFRKSFFLFFDIKPVSPQPRLRRLVFEDEELSEDPS